MIEKIVLALLILYNTILISIILGHGYKRKRNLTFSGLIFFATIWTVTILVTDSVQENALVTLWSRLSFASSVGISLFLFLFVRSYPRLEKTNKTLSACYYFVTLGIFFLSLSKYIVSDFHAGKTVFSWGQPVFLLYYIFSFGIGIGILLKKFQKYRKTKDATQIRYVLVGLSISVGISMVTNIVFPLLNLGEIRSLGPFSMIIFLTLTSISIVKHKLLDIRLIILRTLSYSLIVLILSAFIVTVGIFLPQLVNNVTTQTLVGVAISIVLVLIFDPLKKYISKITDKFFFKARINYQNLLHKLSEIINKEINLDELLFKVEKKLHQEMKIQSAEIILPKHGGSAFISQFKNDKEGNILLMNGSLVKYINRKQVTVVLDDLERKIEDTTDEKERIELEHSKEELDQLKAAVVSPVITSDGRIAAILVLGGKLSGDPYSNEDLNLLQLLGPQLASALEKARLYEEIRLFNVKLQKEVEIATEKVKMKNVQLEDRNRFLSAVSKVTSLITQTLEFKKVTQSIVDAIATELGFVGGLLLFLGESRRKVFPEAVTNKPITEKVLKLLPKPLNEYWGDFTTDKTLNIEAMKAQQVRTGTDLAAFLSPPVPKLALGAIQKAAGIKTIVSVPIIAEQEVVGCIDFMIAKTPDLVTKNDYDMMQAMANQTGVVYRNIELVRRLESSNRELGEANEHLKELDQAKSEFVSIASHQLRTPMTGIMGYLSMIVGGDFGKLDAGLQKVLEQLLDASQRMIRLINLFLDVTKIESGKLSLDKQPVHLEELIDKELQVLQKLASDKKLKLVYVKPKVALPILMIDDKITDVVLNLVDNAIKYTETGGITITSEREGDWVHVKVQDTGRGLDPKEARSLFNKFVRGYGIAQVNPDGSGLGLYVARRLVEVHGGRIWVESDGPGKGSCFQFTLPVKAVDTKFEPAGAALVTSPKPVVE